MPLTDGLRQVFVCQQTWSELSLVGNYRGLTSTGAVEFSEEKNGREPWSVAGVFLNLLMTLDSPVPTVEGVDEAFLFMVRLNGTDTDLGVAFAVGDTQQRCTDVEMRVAPGDYLTLHGRSISGGAINVTFQLAVEFQSDADNLSGYASQVIYRQAQYGGAFFTYAYRPVPLLGSNVMPTSGTITRWDVLSQAPVAWYGGPTDGFDFQLVVNGVAVPSSLIELRGTQFHNYATPALHVEVGDVVEIYSAGVSYWESQYYGTSLAFAADVEGEYLFCSGSSHAVVESDVTLYTSALGMPEGNWEEDADLNNTLNRVYGSITPFWLGTFTLLASEAPGVEASGQSYTFSASKNDTDSADDPTIVLTDTETFGQDLTNALFLTESDYVTLRCVPTNTPAGQPWTLYAFVANTPMPSDSMSPSSSESASASASPSPEPPRRIRRLRQSPHLSDEQVTLFFAQFQIDLEAGLGLTEGQGLDPMLMLQWSNDSGHTWSDELWIPAGRLGQYKWRAIWRRLGRARTRTWRVVVSDPVAWRFNEVFVQASKGTN